MERFSAPSPDRRVQSTVPESATLAQFLESPRLFRPKPEYINATFFVDDDTVLTHAIKIQNVAAVEVLLRGGADANAPSKKGIAPISGAAHKGNTAIMQLLIANGAQVNSMNSTGSTALIQASHFGHLEAVKLLLYHNATADFSNQKGTTALMRASQEGHVDISKCLIESGVDVNKKNHEGMNALMLASQRGHASIVYVLVKAGAAMDEQTAQGSTALMLACKRGHEKCAEVLVSMGAEIYMRDRRMRTAKDTATRRNHHALLCWLDTQMQVMRIQEGRHRQRIAMLSDLRTAHLKGRLRFNGSMEGLGMLYGVVQRLVLKASAGSVGGASPGSDERLVAEFSRNAHAFAVSATRQPQDTLAAMQRSVLNEANCNAAIVSQPVFRSSTRMAPRHEGFSDWQWPFLMNRCMALPSGLFELVMEYMPLPRVWQWSLLRLKRRCKLAPQQAVQDLSVIMDEILCDSAIFAGADQKNLLMKINRSPQVHSFLLEQLDMPEALLETLCSYADTQSLLLRTTELEVAFKPHFARNMLTAAAELYRWHRNHTSALKLLALQPHTPASSTGGLPGLRGAGHARKGSGIEGDDIEDADMETTDIAGEEEEEGQEDGEEEVSDFEGEFAQAEPDTENEMVVDDGGQILDDSDSEAEHNPQAGNVNIFAVGL